MSTTLKHRRRCRGSVGDGLVCPTRTSRQVAGLRYIGRCRASCAGDVEGGAVAGPGFRKRRHMTIYGLELHGGEI